MPLQCEKCIAEFTFILLLYTSSLLKFNLTFSHVQQQSSSSFKIWISKHLLIVLFIFFHGFSLHLSTEPPSMWSILLTIESIDFLHTCPNQLSRDLTILFTIGASYLAQLPLFNVIVPIPIFCIFCYESCLAFPLIQYSILMDLSHFCAGFLLPNTLSHTTTQLFIWL